MGSSPIRGTTFRGRGYSLTQSTSDGSHDLWLPASKLADIV